METIIGSYTENWMMIIGVVFILFVIFAPNGIMGIVDNVKGIFAKKQTEAELEKNLLQPIKQQTKLDG